MQDKIKEIIAKHYGEILEELEEFIDTDELILSIEIEHEDFQCKLS
jgi:hypothetical protein